MSSNKNQERILAFLLDAFNDSPKNTVSSKLISESLGIS